MARWVTILVILALPGLHGEIIDRIAVSIGTRVITESDLQREIRITAFLNGDQPDFHPQNQRATAERMVDQTLVRAELESSGYPMPSEAEAAAALLVLKSRFSDDEAYRRALAAYNISESALKDRLSWQLTLVRFIDVRFRPGIQISDDAIRTYYNENLHTLTSQAPSGNPPSLDAVHDQIERTLISQAADQQVERSLTEARKRARIQYREDAFR